MPENALNHKIPRLPKSAAKNAVSVLRVDYVTPYTALLHLYTCVRSYFGCPLGQISTFSSLFWHQIGTFITTEGQDTAFRALYQFSQAL